MVSVEGSIVEFRFYRPQAKQVWLAGDFNNWRNHELSMKKSSDGYWVARLKLPPGAYRFRYRADGTWFTDYASFGLEAGPFGFDSVVRVARVVAAPRQLNPITATAVA